METREQKVEKFENWLEANEAIVNETVVNEIDKLSMNELISKVFGFSKGKERLSVQLKYHEDKKGAEFSVTSDKDEASAYYWGMMFMGAAYLVSRGNPEFCRLMLKDSMEMLAVLNDNYSRFKGDLDLGKDETGQDITKLVLASMGQIVYSRYLYNEEVEKAYKSIIGEEAE